MASLCSRSDEEILHYLEDFNTKHSTPLAKLNLEFEDQKKLWISLLQLIADPQRNRCHGALLQASKILTRNQKLMAEELKKETLELFLKKGGIISSFSNTHTVREDKHDRDLKSIDESLRCLYNIYLQCTKTNAALSLGKDMISGIIYQTTRYKDLEIPLSVIFFDMRLLFLVTVYCEESRILLHIDSRGIPYLTDILVHCIDEAKADNQTHPVLNEEHVSTTKTTLQVLFNCTLAFDPKQKPDEELMSNLSELCRILNLLLTMEKESPDLRMAIARNVTNLLTNFPPGECTEPLMQSINKDTIEDSNSKEIEYDRKCMNGPREILDFLIETLVEFESGRSKVTTLRESFAPVFFVLHNLSYGHRHIREYYRSVVLPPLRVLNVRQEEGDVIRSRICHLLTRHECSVSHFAAEFLFILCKEDYKQLIKHTGYGNVSWLLMRGVRRPNQYPDDDDSDTEEYRGSAHIVNLFTRHVEPERSSPFEGMTEEQKEYEAEKLANTIHRLHTLGVFTPGRRVSD